MFYRHSVKGNSGVKRGTWVLPHPPPEQMTFFTLFQVPGEGGGINLVKTLLEAPGEKHSYDAVVSIEKDWELKGKAHKKLQGLKNVNAMSISEFQHFFLT